MSLTTSVGSAVTVTSSWSAVGVGVGSEVVGTMISRSAAAMSGSAKTMPAVLRAPGSAICARCSSSATVAVGRLLAVFTVTGKSVKKADFGLSPGRWLTVTVSPAHTSSSSVSVTGVVRTSPESVPTVTEVALGIISRSFTLTVNSSAVRPNGVMAVRLSSAFVAAPL